MKPELIVTHEFVESVPAEMADLTLYVSIKYRTVLHKCCCGCGNKVVTPLKPSQWALTYNGKSIWLSPSVGNWSFPCKSHYWIKDSKVIWSDNFSTSQIEMVRRSDAAALDEQFARAVPISTKPGEKIKGQMREEGYWQKFKKWFGRP